MEATQQAKVIPLRTEQGLFSPVLRRKLEEGVKPVSDRPSEIVEKIEMVLCAAIVGVCLAVAKSVGTRAGKSIAKAFSGNR